MENSIKQMSLQCEIQQSDICDFTQHVNKINIFTIYLEVYLSSVKLTNVFDL